MIDHLVTITDRKAVTTSLIVAEAFEKQHQGVMRSIRNLECSDEFRRCNFAPSSYLNEQNKTQPMYTITRDGFTFLAMGFTGKKAAEFKERFIAAFNQMEQMLLGGIGPARNFNFNYLRGTNAPGGLDVRYNLDLTPFIRGLPPVEQVKVVEQLTGIQLPGIVDSLVKKNRRRQTIRHSIDPALVADCLEIISHGGEYPGVVVEKDGSISGATAHINATIKSVADLMRRPYNGTGFQLGELFNDRDRKMCQFGWCREFIRTVRGIDQWRYSKTKERCNHGESLTPQ